MGFEKELAVARDAAARAGELALEYFRAGVAAEDKADDSPVTVADRECEKVFVKLLSEAFPEDGFLGEEGAGVEGRSGRRWIIDPIDGTRDFVRRNRLWCNLIGLEVDGVVEVGVCTFPALGNQYWAVRGGGAWRSDAGGAVRMHCSEIHEARRAVVCLNQMNHALEYPRAEKILPFLSQFWASRSLGGALDAMFLASGSAEVWMEPSLKPWDLAAISIIVREAGCVFFDYAGRETIYGGNGVICVPGLEPVVREFLDLPPR
jgi:histidinol phosphatase-like enzyme (inositol monophosphatase family)